MIIMMKRSWRLPGEWRWILASLVMLTIWHCEANELTFEFKDKVVAASCTINVDSPTVTLGVGGRLDPTSLIGSDWAFIGESDVAVSLSGCAGTPDAGTLPYVGVSPSAGTEQLTVIGLYRGNDSKSQGFGVVMGNIANATSLLPNALVTKSVPHVRLKAAGAATDGIYKLRVGVTCGPSASCTRDLLKPGSLNAAFTLDFNYH